MKRILLIEDDINLSTSLKEYLNENGFSVDCAFDLKTADDKIKLAHDLILLDWNLPDGIGIDWLKSYLKTSPIIMLTSRSELADKVLGLEFGANDYITKPFEPRELLARIRVQLRDIKAGNATNVISNSGIQINIDSHEVSYKGKSLELTKIEFKLLKLLIENPRKVFSRERLLDLVWEQKSVSTRTIDVHLGQLRQKLKPELFETLHAVGYRFVPIKEEI
jgi:DNA-binding response OmpR family regulator